MSVFTLVSMSRTQLRRIHRETITQAEHTTGHKSAWTLYPCGFVLFLLCRSHYNQSYYDFSVEITWKPVSAQRGAQCTGGGGREKWHLDK